MKILSIGLKNLASLAGEHHIDFESEPLASAGLIAIVGKTGAGKSTLLDAMCLALFNKVPRLKEGDGKLIDADGSELAANASQTVLRRGCAHGFAELCFVAQDQKRYLVRWELKRARENPNGKLQSVQRFLKCLDDGVVIADKTKAVEEQIKKITQLSFEQFTRAVLLAQSEVTAFLKARDAERGELLEYLTNSNIFGKIGELAYKKTSEINKQRKQLEDVLGHIELLSDEAHEELQQQLEQCNQQRASHEQQKLEQQQYLQWFQHRTQLETQILQQQQQHQIHCDALLQMDPQRIELERLEQFSTIRSTYGLLQQHIKTEQSLAEQFQSKQRSFVAIKQQFELEKYQFQTLEQTVNQQQDFEQQHQAELKQLNALIEQRHFIKDDLALCKEKLQTLAQQRHPLLQQQQRQQQQFEQQQQALTQCMQGLGDTEQFASLDQALPTHIQQLEQFIPAYQKIEAQLGHVQQAKQQFQRDQQVYLEQEQRLGSIATLEQRVEQLQAQHAEQLLQLNRFQNVQQQFESFYASQANLIQLSTELEQRKAEQQQLAISCPAAEQAYLTAQTECLQLNQILQQQRLLHTENIEKLRAELKDNQACLVCGSLQHPYREDHSALSKSLFDLQQQQLTQAEAQQKVLFQDWQGQQQAHTQCSSRLQHLEQQFQQYTQTQQQSIAQLTEALDRFELQLDFHGDAEQIKTALQQHEQALKLTYSELDTQKAATSQGLKQQRESQIALQQRQQLLNQAEQLEQHFAHLIVLQNNDAQTQLSQSAIAMLQQLKQRAMQRQQQQQIQSDIDHSTTQQQTLEAQLLNMQQNNAALEAESARLLQLGIDINQQAIRLIADMTGEQVTKANEWMSSYQQKIQQSQQQYRESRTRFDLQQQSFQHEDKLLAQLELQSNQAKQQCSDSQAQVAAWLVQHPTFTQANLGQLLSIPIEQEKTIRLQLQHQERLVNEAAAALKTITTQLDTHQKQQPDMDLSALERQIAANQEALDSINAIRDQLSLKLELHQQSLLKQQQFLTQIQAVQQQEQRWGKISGLMGDATGKKFRDIAQQYHLDILVEHANQQLVLLSQRYTLKRLDNSLSLAIIDHDMDGETRSVASLSGGESFLTALALSLAIANMASGSMKIESLFIDEGFGTLDASSLHMVMNALDQLQSQGRKVVLISHIPDMHERIPVQIQVKARGAGASTIQVVA